MNGKGERVRWALASLVTLDELTEGRLGDSEVFSKWTDLRPSDSLMTLDTRFVPDKPGPVSSGVSLLSAVREGKRQRKAKRNVRRRAKPADR